MHAVRVMRGVAIRAIALSCLLLSACSGPSATESSESSTPRAARKVSTSRATVKNKEPTVAPAPTGFRVAPRLSVDQTAYPGLAIVAGESGGRVLIGPQGDVACGDWKMNATTQGTTIDVQRFTGPPKDAPCYGSPRSLWKPLSVPRGSSSIVLRYRGASSTYRVVVEGRDVRVTRASGGDAARVIASGRWWMLPSDFLYARAQDRGGVSGGGARACARIEELVLDAGGRSFTTPVGLPLPRLKSAAEAPGNRAENAGTMLSRPPPSGCASTYLFRASDATLQKIANDASCEQALVEFVRDIPDGHTVVADPADGSCSRSELDAPLGLD